MAVNNTEKFYLIRFLERPFRNVNKYVCVPNSWLIWKLANQMAYVAYPEEDLETTRRRVENHEKPVENWKIFEAKVEYESDTYEYADIWAATEEMDQSEDTNGAITIEDGDITDNVYHTRTIVHDNTSFTNGASNAQIRHKHLRSPLSTFRKKLSTPKKSDLSRLYNPLAHSSNRESLSVHSLHSPDIVNNLILNQDVNKQNTYLNNVKQTMASNQFYHLSKNPDQQHLSVVTDNFLHYGDSNEALVNKYAMGRNGNYQTTQDMKPATQSLINLMKRQSQLSQIIQGNTLNINDQAPHQTQHELEIPYRPAEGYCISQTNQPSNVTNYTSSASVYNDQQLPPAITNNFQLNPCVNNTNKKVTPQKIRQNILLAEPNPFKTKTRPPCSCICLHGKRLSSITPSQLSQDNQVPLDSELTVEKNCRQSAHSKTETEDRSCVGQNSLTCEQPQYTQVVGVEKMPDNELVKILKSKIAKSPANSCPGTATANGSKGSQRLSNVLNKFETEAKENFINDFKLLFSEMNKNLSVSYKAHKDLKRSNAEYDKTLKKIIGIVTKQYTFIIDQVLSSKSKKVKKLKNKLKRKKKKKHDSNNDLSNHEDDEECEEDDDEA